MPVFFNKKIGSFLPYLIIATQEKKKKKRNINDQKGLVNQTYEQDHQLYDLFLVERNIDGKKNCTSANCLYRSLLINLMISIVQK